MSLNFIFKSLRPKYKLLWNNCGVLFSGLQSEHILLHYCYFFTQCFWFLSTFIWENLNYICIHTHTHTHTHTQITYKNILNTALSWQLSELYNSWPYSIRNTKYPNRNEHALKQVLENSGIINRETAEVEAPSVSPVDKLSPKSTVSFAPMPLLTVSQDNGY